MAVRNEAVFSILNSMNFLDSLLPHITTSAPNQLMIIRCFANIMKHELGRQEVNKHVVHIIEQINRIKGGSNNLQIAIATFYLNQTIAQINGIANGDKCRFVAEGLVEFLKWVVDLEACYRSMQAIGNLTTTPFGQEISAIVISADFVMDKLKTLTNTPQSGGFVKINSAGSALLKAF